MPVVSVHVPAGSLDGAQKSDLIARITDAVVDVERAEYVRPFVYVIINETSRDGYGLGGQPVDETLAKLSQR